jgi:WD40 repeat protein
MSIRSISNSFDNTNLDRPNYLSVDEVLELVAILACQGDKKKCQAIGRIKQLEGVPADLIRKMELIIREYNPENGPKQLEGQLASLIRPQPPLLIHKENFDSLESSQASDPELSWQKLPIELATHIFFNLSPLSAGGFRLVCKKWHRSVEHIKDAFLKSALFCQELFCAHFPSSDSTQITDFRAAYRNLHFNFRKGTHSSDTFLNDGLWHAHAQHFPVYSSIAMQNGMIYLASGYSNVVGIEVRDEKTGVLKHFIKAQQERITNIAIEGEQLFSSHINGVIAAWDLKRQTLIHTFKEHEYRISSIVIKDRILCSGSKIGINIWDLKNFKLITNFEGSTGTSPLLAVGNEKLYSTCKEGGINVWSLKSFKFITTFKAHDDKITSLIIGNGKLYSSSKDKTFKAWDLKNHSCITCVATPHTVSAIAIENERLFLSILGQKIDIWDSNTYACIASLPEMALSSGGRLSVSDGRLYTIDNSCSIKIRDFTVSQDKVLSEIAHQFKWLPNQESFESEDASPSEEYCSAPSEESDALDEPSEEPDAPHKKQLLLLERFVKMPEHIQRAIFLELYEILNSELQGNYQGSAEDAFYERNGEHAAPSQKALAIENYLAKKH